MQGAADAGFPPEAELLLRFGVALLLGVLLGLERERRKSPETGFAGVRTFGLISLCGALSAWIGEQLLIPWVAPAAFAAVAILVVASYVVTAMRGEIGITTEISALVAFLLGLVCERGELQLASSVAVAVVLVLVLKDWLHALARRIEAEDVSATLQFAIVALIVLPIVPDETFGPPPFDVLNPYRIWLMVVLISAIDFASWLLVKLLGREHGIGLTGLLGGLVSSTATTLSFTKRSREETGHAPALALGILLAWAVMVARVAVLAGISQSGLLAQLWPTLVAMGLLNLVTVAVLWQRARRDGRAEVASGSNPFRLSNAIRFGLLFGVVLFLARAAETWLGTSGLYLAGTLAGLTDVDAITLSMGQLAGAQPDLTQAASRTVALACVSNTLVKGGIAVVAGSGGLRAALVPGTLLIAGAGAAVAFLL